jgi:hypothetical protein
VAGRLAAWYKGRVARGGVTMRKSVLVAAVLAVGLLAAQQFRAPAQVEKAPTARAVKWEYKVVSANERDLNELGNDGWEFAGIGSDVTGRSTGAVAGPVGEVTTAVRVILKRAK